VNPAYQRPLEDAGLTVSGRGGAGEIRIVELRDHPFFVATLFLPQARSTAERPHPLLAGFAAAVAARTQAAGRAPDEPGLRTGRGAWFA
jgi:CTP synthase (UTP-ammonia lyase)